MTDTGGADTPRGSHGRGRSVKFIRDVGINVIANLVAAAIIYLLGTLAGLFPRSPAGIGLAVLLITVLAIASVGAVFGASNAVTGKAAEGALALVLGIAFIVWAYYGHEYTAGRYATGGVLASLGVARLVHAAKLKRSH